MKLAWWREELRCGEVGKLLQSYVDGERYQLLARLEDLPLPSEGGNSA